MSISFTDKRLYLKGIVKTTAEDNIYDLVHCDMYKSDERYRAMVNDSIVERIENNGGAKFFGYMYGEPFHNVFNIPEVEVRRDELIEMTCSPEDISNDKSSFWYIWGWPGPDLNEYKFADYGITWAFTKGEVRHLTLDEWKAYKIDNGKVRLRYGKDM